MANFLNGYMKAVLALLACLGVVLSAERISADTNDLPRPAALVLKKSYDFLEKNEISSAINVLESFLVEGRKKAAPKGPDKNAYRHYLVLFTLGNCYLMSDNPEKARLYYQDALKEKADFSPAWLNLAKCQFELNDHISAGHSFIKGYETSENNPPEFLYFSAISYMAAEKYETALNVFDRLLTTHADLIKLEWKENIVQAYLAVDQPRNALPFIEELSEKSVKEKKQQWQEIRLHQYMNLGMKQRAVTYAEQLIREYPVDPKWWKALAHLHLAENRYEKGLVALTVYSHLTPLTVEEKKLMAELNLSVGVPAQAVLFYEDILSENLDMNILKKLAESYITLRQGDEALKWVEKGLETGLDEDLLMLKGNVLFEEKKYDAAMDVFESIPAGKNSGHALIMLGYSAWNAGNMDKAKHAFHKALTYPEHQKTAQNVLQQLEKIENQEKS